MKIFIPLMKSLLFIPLLILGVQSLEAQNVVVPAADKAKASSIVFNTTTSKQGETIYKTNCISCHGDPGKGNFLKGLNPPPADLGTEKAQNQTDGELFYKISEGNIVMPKFKSTLSVEDRWKLVGYIRSFNSKYVQPALQVAATNQLSKSVQIDINYNLTTNRISFLVKALLKKDTVLLKGSDASLFVKRYFGKLQIGTTTKTDEKGVVSFEFPKDLPGDVEGNIELIASVNDNVYGEIIKSKIAKIGIPTNMPPLNEKRAMWNVESKAPLWLMFTYFSIVIGVWLTIGYIVLNIIRIKRISSKINN